MTLQLLLSELLMNEENLIFFFISDYCSSEISFFGPSYACPENRTSFTTRQSQSFLVKRIKKSFRTKVVFTHRNLRKPGVRIALEIILFCVRQFEKNSCYTFIIDLSLINFILLLDCYCYCVLRTTTYSYYDKNKMYSVHFLLFG
jgi:hypothetical protein